MGKIKVLITDDQADLAEELKNLIETDDALEVVGIASDGFEALEKMGLARYCVFDFGIIRGLDYYTFALTWC